jgi:hypothetical protein
VRSAEERAKAIAAGEAADFETVEELAGKLLETHRTEQIAPMLIEVSRRALYHGWEPEDRERLAKLDRDHQQFGYARKLVGRVRAEGEDRDELRELHALCTYKDMELPAARRLDRALEEQGLGESREAERLRARADEIRSNIVEELRGDDLAATRAAGSSRGAPPL